MTPKAQFWQLDLFNGGHETCNHKVYKLACDQYEQLLARAGGHCEVCGIAGRSAPRGKLYIDHDHGGGWTAVRGLVCAHCNILIRDVEMGRRVDGRVTAYLAHPWHSKQKHQRSRWAVIS